MTILTSSAEQSFLDDLNKKLWNAADRLRANLYAAVSGPLFYIRQILVYLWFIRENGNAGAATIGLN